MFMLAFHLTVGGFLLFTLVQVGFNLRVFRAPRPAARSGDPAAAPFVSILVPARNEAHRIGPCVNSLLAQDYSNYELLVLDDHSEDDTAALVRGFGLREEGDAGDAGATTGRRHRLLRGEPLPPGWTGKAWACQQLGRAARGEFLLFTDADTVHEPGALGAVVAHAQETRADLLSAWPKQLAATWSERLVIPLVYVLVLGFLPLAVFAWFQERLDLARRGPRDWLRKFGAANGQFILFRRGAYEAIGGHAAVREHLVEDVALGRAVAARTAEGLRVVNCDGSALVRCRMYRSFPELWEGFTKNLRPAFEDSEAAFWFSGLAQFGAFVLPFVLAAAWTLAGWGGRWGWLAWGNVALVYAIRGLLTARFRTSWLSWALHPVGHGLALLIALNSWRLSAKRGVRWKGRTYRMSSPAMSTAGTPPSVGK